MATTKRRRLTTILGALAVLASACLLARWPLVGARAADPPTSPAARSAVATAPASTRAPADTDVGDVRKIPVRPWEAERDAPPHVSTDPTAKVDYPVVYVRVPRAYPQEYRGINHLNQAGLHQTNPPGAELRLLHPDGRDESLVPVAPRESITDPAVSFDGEWVYFARFHHMDVSGSVHMSKLQSRGGADLYKIHVPTRKVVRLTGQTRTPNAGAIPPGVESHRRGVHNLAPCPVAGGRIVFVSDRNGYRGVREQTQPALQLFVMDDDGRNVELIGHLNLGTALHPVPLKDGRVMFSSLETQGLRSSEQWGIWAIRPDGTQWGPIASALGSPPGQAVHFQAQLSDGAVVIESYYQTGSTDGFGTYWKIPPPAADRPAFLPGAKDFAPAGLVDLTLFATFGDVRPNHGTSDLSNRTVIGNVTHPSGAPDDHLLTVWAPPREGQEQSTEVYDAGLYLLKSGRAINHPSKMRLIKNDPAYQELWPRALVPYKRIHGIDEPPRFAHRNDGTASPHLPAGTPFGLVGSSSLYKRESAPQAVVPAGSVTAAAQKPADRRATWRDLSFGFGRPGNWGSQGADAGLYENSDIWGVRILLLEPVSEVVHQEKRHFAIGSRGEERIRVLGEFPVRKFDGDVQPTDPDGNPDTSFLAKIPADVAWTFQTLDDRGMVLNMAQTWHQVRPGEVRHDCGGCHAHSQQPTPFEATAAARPDYPVWDLVARTPLFTTKPHDRTGRRWDKADRTGVRFAAGVQDVEFHRDVEPILDRSCTACHSRDRSVPAGRLVLDDRRPLDKPLMLAWSVSQSQVPQGMPRNYARLLQYSWAFQSRRSLLAWKIHGRRLDGFANEDVPSPPLDYDDPQDLEDWSHHSRRFGRDVDYVGSEMPPPTAVAGTYEGPDGRPIRVPPLSDEDKLVLVRWIDLGCPIDRDYDPARPDERGRGWRLDESRPTLALASPAPGRGTEPFSRILFGLHDCGTGLDPASLTVAADFAIDGTAPGANLASKLRPLPGSRWELRLEQPLRRLPSGTLTVSVKDRQGNETRIERSFSVTPAAE